MPVPVPNQSVVDYPHAPVILDTIAVERTSTKLGNYTAVEPGTQFSPKWHSSADAARFTGLYFLGQKASADSEWIEQYWGSGPATQDIGNYNISYSAESQSAPIFVRRYLEPRDTYPTTQRARGSVFTGLYAVAMTAAGAAYTSAPTVVFTGGGGAGATAIAVLNNSGSIIKVTIKAEGTGYTSAPAVSFTGGGGAGATATAYVQASTCLMVKEDTKDAPAPYDSLYLEVVRVYETLPGPWVKTTRIDPDSEEVDVQTRRNLVANVTTEEDITAGVWKKTSLTNSDSFVGNEVKETRLALGNTMTSSRISGESDIVTVVERMMDKTTFSDGESNPGGVENQKISRKAISNLEAWQVAEIFNLPGPVRTSYLQNPSYQIGSTVTVQKVNQATTGPTSPVAGQTVESKALDAYVSDQTTTLADTSALSTFFIAIPAQAEISLPRVLTSLTAIWDTAGGNGDFTENGSGSQAGSGSVSVSLNASGRGQGSASVMPELVPVFKSRPFGTIPVMNYLFFMPFGTTAAQILEKVETFAGAEVFDWPVFKPDEPTITYVGQKVSMSAEGSARFSLSVGSAASYATSSGGGQNYDWGQSIKTMTLPACLHTALGLAGDMTKTKNATASGAAAIAGFGSFPGAAGAGSASGTASGYITPTTLVATSPTTFPTSLLYMERYDLQVSREFSGYFEIRARVLDAAFFA